MTSRIPERLQHKKSQLEMIDTRILTSFPPLPSDSTQFGLDGKEIDENMDDSNKTNESNESNYGGIVDELSVDTLQSVETNRTIDSNYDYQNELHDNNPILNEISRDFISNRCIIDQSTRDEYDEFENIIKRLKGIAGKDLKIRQSIADFRKIDNNNRDEYTTGHKSLHWWFSWIQIRNRELS